MPVAATNVSMESLIVFLALASLCRADGLLPPEYPTTTTTEGPPNPYSFQYSAGRYPGHVDRIQTEVGDGTGRVKGSYSFVDPKQKLRTVEYTVDENGFHPALINYGDVLNYRPKDSEAVSRARERHRVLYEKIAASNARSVPAQLPKDSVSVARAKSHHHSLYQKIAAEHAAIGAERAAQRLAFEATSVANEVNEEAVFLD